ncbi:MAG: Uma2 family endonuclease [Caldilineaceae bacterium]|nr:Uma2 family endonuclease [Caldilineaceae bacterium]
MQWKDVVADPNLQDLPFKIETNEWGQIVMTPARLKRGHYQSKIIVLLQALVQASGEVITECPIQTPKGTKVADVAWFSQERWEQVKDEFDSPIAPEICIEILSPSNSAAEILEKQKLYFAKGADEVWICDATGKMEFYLSVGVTAQSQLVPEFPIEILK